MHLESHRKCIWEAALILRNNKHLYYYLPNAEYPDKLLVYMKKFQRVELSVPVPRLRWVGRLLGSFL